MYRSVQWKLDNDEDKTWGPFEVLKDQNSTITAQQMGLAHYFPNVTRHLFIYGRPTESVHKLTLLDLP